MTPTLHDSNKVLLGTTQSSEREISIEPSDPANFPAGTAVRRKSDGTLSTDSGDGALIGVSAGRSLSDTEKTAVIRTGLRVPLRLQDEGVAASADIDDVTFTMKEKGTFGNDWEITTADELSDGSASVETFDEDEKEIVIHIESGVTTAQAIADAVNNHPELSELIVATIGEGQEAAAQTASGTAESFADGEESYPYVEMGAAVETDDNGLATSDGASTGAVYVSAPMKGVDPITKAEVDVALVDMPGGL